MPDLRLGIEGADVVLNAAAPLLAFKLRLVNDPSEEIIQTVVLKAQIQIEVTRRKYDANEQARLRGFVRRAGPVGTDVAKHAVDARERSGAALHRYALA